MAEIIRPIPEPDPATAVIEFTQDELDILRALLGRCVSGGITSGLYGTISRAGGRHRAYRVKEETGGTYKVVQDVSPGLARERDL